MASDINIKLPQSWAELSKKQAKNISYILHCTTRSIVNIPQHEFIILSTAYVQIAKELLRHNPFKATKLALKELLPKAYEPFVQFLFKEEVSLQQFPLEFKSNKSTLYGPAQRLRNLSIEEFSFADALYYRFKTTNDKKYLDLLCSTLYRPKSETKDPTDIRTPYQRLLAEANYDYFSQLHLKEKIVVCYAFEGSRNHLVNQFPHVFPKIKTNNNKTQSKPKYTPIGKLISAKIDYDPSKLATANKMNVYSFFSVYESELIEIKKIKRK